MKKKLIKNYAQKLSNEMGRKVSLQEAEEEIVRVIQNVARTIAPQFRFGYHSVEDMEQEGIMEALKVLETDKYDVSRPLGNFLYVHVHNRLSNFRRKHYMRHEPPCGCCDTCNPPAHPCQKFLDWKARNATKQNLMRPVDISNIAHQYKVSGIGEDGVRECCVVGVHDDFNIIDKAIGAELRLILDKELPVDLRRDYLQMLDGKTVPKVRREKVRQGVLNILREHFEEHNDAQALHKEG